MNTWILAFFAMLALAVLNTPTLAQTPTAVTNMAATPMATAQAAASTPMAVIPVAAEPDANANMRIAVEEPIAGPPAG
ncbi:hypothetical protein HK102_007034, partial [Quaeritorhiza haematococci]